MAFQGSSREQKMIFDVNCSGSNYFGFLGRVLARHIIVYFKRVSFLRNLYEGRGKVKNNGVIFNKL